MEERRRLVRTRIFAPAIAIAISRTLVSDCFVSISPHWGLGSTFQTHLCFPPISTWALTAPGPCGAVIWFGALPMKLGCVFGPLKLPAMYGRTGRRCGWAAMICPAPSFLRV